MDKHRLKAYLFLLITTIIWAVAGPIIKATLNVLSPLVFLTYRFWLASIFAVFYILITNYKLPKDKKTLWLLIVYSFLTSPVALGLLFFGLKNTTVLDLTIIDVVNPLLMTLAGVIFLNEHITKKEKLGMAIVLIGTFLTIAEPLLNNHSGIHRFSGNLLILAYLITNTAAVVILKKLLRAGIEAMALVNLTFIIGFIVFLPLTLVIEGFKNPLSQIQNLSPLYHFFVFYMAFISGTIAYYLGNKGQKTIEVSEASLFIYLYPIFSLPLAILWLKERVTTPFLIGSAIVAIGVIIAETKSRKKPN